MHPGFALHLLETKQVSSRQNSQFEENLHELAPVNLIYTYLAYRKNDGLYKAVFYSYVDNSLYL